LLKNRDKKRQKKTKNQLKKPNNNKKRTREDSGEERATRQGTSESQTSSLDRGPQEEAHGHTNCRAGPRGHRRSSWLDGGWRASYPGEMRAKKNNSQTTKRPENRFYLAVFASSFAPEVPMRAGCREKPRNCGFIGK
jgi:hypothetical protein